MPGDFGDRFQRGSVDRRIPKVEDLADPSTNPATVQFNPDNGPDPHWTEARRNLEVVGNQIVEALVQPGDVGQNASDATGHTVPGTV